MASYSQKIQLRIWSELEPFTRCYPEYEKGGCQQFIYKGTIYFKNIDIIEDYYG